MSATPYHSTHTGAEIDAAVDAVQSYVDPAQEGFVALGSGVSSGSVTGLGLAFTPTKVQLQIETPSGGFVMFAVVVRGTITAAGFDFYLSGETDSANYRLHYRLTE